ncbi:methionyl-tRNA formyltransferase [Gleimia coleocanis DSM 15436]|uniref:Methionyl-tRNA formyltransferase n=1 Tax=Gleimia coleocanis DSM 15436 TaxID=525245 RepID=C0W1K4_9ACTO|nr:methionyl-tRNA formyltransferase [Gleimia coleocanis]EEH63370.1 methionyl-tRNA formyltransferase [Gleimia coleocanis DSM 15436]
MKIIFAGTPQVAVPTLQALVDSPHEVVAVITRSAKPKGRGKTLIPSEVGAWATEHGLNVLEADSLRGEEIQSKVASLNADLGVVVAYGAIIPQHVLDMPKHGWVNLHFSDLPRWRGAAPVQRAIEAGDQTTAVNIFQLEAGLDTGPVFFSRQVAIDEQVNAGDLLASLAESGAPDVVSVVDAITAGTAAATPQVEDGVTYAHMLSKADLALDFMKSARVLHNQVRACAPTPAAFTELPDGKRLKVLRTQVAADCPVALQPGQVHATKKQVWVGTADGVLELLAVAPAGKNQMEAAAWARGARLEENMILGAVEGA